MKKILLAALVLTTGLAHADTCSKALMPAFTAAQATKLCSSFGSSVKSSLVPSANNTYDIGSSSLRWKDLYLSGVVSYSNTAMTVFANTADAADANKISIGGGGAALGTRGGYVILEGNENGGGGRAFVGSGAGTLGFDVNSATRWRVGTDGSLNSLATNGGDLNMSGPGLTLAIQESAAGNACSGTLTSNGTTDVVTSTTCATTGSRIFLTRTSNTAFIQGYVKSISTGVSFTYAGTSASDNGTYNWWIIHESP